MASGKSINPFLMDGTPSGRIKCTIANFTGVTSKISRTDMDIVEQAFRLQMGE